MVLTHRDPVKAQASIVSMLGTLYWMRSDKPFDASAYEALLRPQAVAAGLNQLIDWLESGAIPRRQVFGSRYADLLQAPVENLRRLYSEMDLSLSEQAAAAMERYLTDKPQGKFGIHRYEVDAQLLEARTWYARYQDYFDVPSEIA